MTTMTPLAQEWISALRSGEYQQIKGRLHNNTGYCCLGVACEISDPTRWKNHGDGVFSYLTEIDYLPVSVIRELGITREFETILVNRNDAGHTFPELADLIEKELKGHPQLEKNNDHT